MPLPSKLGIVAGGGILPEKLHAFCNANNIDNFVIGFEGHANPNIARRLVRVGEAGQILSIFHDAGYKDLVIIGAVKRPKFSEMRPDLRTAAFFAKLGLRAIGDDGFLKAIRAELEKEGFSVHGIQDFIPGLMLGAGVLTKRAPDDFMYEDIHMGLMASRHIGKKDIGQSVVVCDGEVIGEEDDKGTNTLIKRAAQKSAILVKSSKPQQDRKLDMPTIGSQTVELCASLGYAGIAAEAGGVLIADQEAMVQRADELGLFVVGV